MNWRLTISPEETSRIGMHKRSAPMANAVRLDSLANEIGMLGICRLRRLPEPSRYGRRLLAQPLALGFGFPSRTLFYSVDSISGSTLATVHCDGLLFDVALPGAEHGPA